MGGNGQSPDAVPMAGAGSEQGAGADVGSVLATARLSEDSYSRFGPAFIKTCMCPPSDGTEEHGRSVKRERL